MRRELQVRGLHGHWVRRQQVIPTPSHLLDRISPISSPFFSRFSPSRRGGSNEPQAGTQGQETAGTGVQTAGNTVSPGWLTPGVRNAWEVVDAAVAVLEAAVYEKTLRDGSYLDGQADYRALVRSVCAKQRRRKIIRGSDGLFLFDAQVAMNVKLEGAAALRRAVVFQVRPSR